MWLSEQFTRGQAWVDMLGLANHKSGYIRKRGVRVELKRGHLGWSQRELADRWKWSRGKIIRFLNELESEHMIEQQKTNVTTLIYIVNYNNYQQYEPKVVPQKEPQTVPETDHKQYLNNNDNKKNIKTLVHFDGDNSGKPVDKSVDKSGKDEFPQIFEETLAIYPKRNTPHNRRAAYKAWKARVNAKVSPEVIKAGVERYRRFCVDEKKVGTQFVKMASTFFGPDEWYLQSWTVTEESKYVAPTTVNGPDGWMAYGKKINKPAKPGETIDQYVERLRGELRNRRYE